MFESIRTPCAQGKPHPCPTCRATSPRQTATKGWFVRHSLDAEDPCSVERDFRLWKSPLEEERGDGAVLGPCSGPEHVSHMQCDHQGQDGDEQKQRQGGRVQQPAPGGGQSLA